MSNEQKFQPGDKVVVDDDDFSFFGLVKGREYTVAHYHDEGPTLTLVGHERTMYSLGHFRKVSKVAQAMTPEALAAIAARNAALLRPGTTYPYVRAAFINALSEEGTKDELVERLQEQWNTACALRKELHEDIPALLAEVARLTAALAEAEKRGYDAAKEQAAQIAKVAWLQTQYGSIADADAMSGMCDELSTAIRAMAF